MVQTVQYWRPAAIAGSPGAYHAAAPGIAVLTNDTNWHVLGADGLYHAGAFPPNFGQDVLDNLNYINRTTAGQQILPVLAGAGANGSVDITPGNNGNNVQSLNQGMALNLVANELLGGQPGVNTRNALFAALGAAVPNLPAAAAWLAGVINASPRWSLDETPGAGANVLGWLQSAREKINQWTLWSDTNEGYFSNQTSLGGQWGSAAGSTDLTPDEVRNWLQGNALPARLASKHQHILVSVIVAMRNNSPAGPGCGAHVRWDNTAANVMNAFRPPAVGLAHELLHAYFSQVGQQLGRDDSHYSTVLFEYRCVGLGPWDEAPISENAIRREWWTAAVPHIPAADGLNRKAPAKRIRYN